MDVIDRFFATAASRGEHLAVQANVESVSYKELSLLSRKFACAFATNESPKVLIAYEQGPLAYAAMLGTMLAGGFYVPVSVNAPSEKIAAICASFRPTLIVGSDAMLGQLRRLAPLSIVIETAQIQAIEPYTVSVARNRIAYVIFTSGSTGQPKGVIISHIALAHYIDWVIDAHLFRASDRVSQYTNIAFDVSVLEIFGGLCAGATIIPFVSQSEKMYPAQLVKSRGITVWISVPSVIRLMMSAKQLTAIYLATVRRLFFAGEPLLEPYVEGIFTVRPDADIWNAYGPTETTVTMTCQRLEANSYSSVIRHSVALGDTIPGMEVHLIGGEAKDSGEIVIVGPQLADGYWNAPDQTAKAFRRIDINGRKTHAYFSGDWGEVVDGRLYFKNRIDDQVKINGVRIELGEVATAIRQLGFADVVVLKQDDELVAVIQAASGVTQELNPGEIKNLLLQKLDRYAVPSRFVAVSEFPRNQNDKTDLRAIAQLVEHAQQHSR